MRVAVVGAGLSGLAAGRALAGSGHEVLVLERSDTVGGRLATIQIATELGHATFDVGAQFFTVRSEQLQQQTDDWMRRRLVREWCRGFGEVPDGHPRYIGSHGMASLAADLAGGLDVRRGAYVFSLHRTIHGWHVVLTDAARIDVDVVVLACPLPQSRALLIQSDVSLPDELVGIQYERTVALLAVLDRPSEVPDPGGVQQADDDRAVLSFVADNQRKGISAVAALTCHAGAAWSAHHWAMSNDELTERLQRAAAPWIGDARIVASRIRRWRLATPHPTWPEPTWADAERAVVLAGDAFAGPRFEGAYRSGLAAAAAVTGLS
jgi:predicted NAD/FAD-dependent oxidoreductase